MQKNPFLLLNMPGATSFIRDSHKNKDQLRIKRYASTLAGKAQLKYFLTGVVGCWGCSGAVGVGTDAVVLCCDKGCCCCSAEGVTGTGGWTCGGSCACGGVGVCLWGGCIVCDCGPGGIAWGVGVGAAVAAAAACCCCDPKPGGVWWGVGVRLGTGEGEFRCMGGCGRGGQWIWLPWEPGAIAGEFTGQEALVICACGKEVHICNDLK